jgi:hypothetical protein
LTLTLTASPDAAQPALRPRLGARFGVVDAAAVARAEAALQSLSSQFGQWLQDEIDKLLAARAAVAADGWNSASAEGLYFRAHDLKGLGGTYEYPIVTRLAASLCRLLDGKACDGGALPLVDGHIDAIVGVVRDGFRAADHPVAGPLAADLEDRVTAHLGR